MKFLPENKARAAIYLGVIVIAGGAAIYFLFFNHAPAPTLSPAAQEHAAALKAAPETTPPAPDLPVSSRPARGRPVGGK